MKKDALLRFDIALHFPHCRMDWVAPNQAIVTSRAGRRWMVTYRPKRKRRRWFWTSLAGWIVPAVIWFWGLWMVVMAIMMILL